ncbi:MAG: hypothetical protein ABI592_14790 [Acidobacteriota bacterium]
MTPRDEDREIARLFEEQRQADEASAPGFRALLARPRAGRTAPARRILRPALAAASILVAAAAILINRPNPREPELLAAGAALAAWKSPTDAFLDTPGSELTSQVPVLVSPAFETNLDALHQQKEPPR